MKITINLKVEVLGYSTEIEAEQDLAAHVEQMTGGCSAKVIKVMGDNEDLLRQALRYIEMQLACNGKALDKLGVQHELERVKGISTSGTGRDIFSMVNVDLDAIRKALGEETALARNSREYSRG